MANSKPAKGSFRNRIEGDKLREIQWEDLDNPFTWFAFLTQPQSAFLDWMKEESLIAEAFDCPHCAQPCRYLRCKARVEGVEWRCRKKHFDTSVTKNSFFEGTRFTIQDILLFIHMYLDNHLLIDISRATGFDYKRTSVQWAVYIREVFAEYFHTQLRHRMLEGDVEIDESLFGRRSKYHRGRPLGMKVWIVGLCQRNTNRLILYPVERRDGRTLTAIIKQHVKAGSTIFSDGWAGYGGLREMGYRHFTVEHKHTFKKVYRDCATGEEIQCHTNTIEGAWARAKRHFVKMNGTSAAQFESHLCEVMWRAWNTDGCRILNFLAFMRNIYTLRAPPAYTYPIPIFPSWAQNEDVTMPGDFDVTQVNIVPQYGSTFMRSVKDFSLVIPPGEDTFTGEEEGGGQIADTDTSVFRSDSLALKVQEELPSIPVLRRSMSWEIPEIRRLNTADPPFPLLHDTTSPQDITSSMPILTAQSVPCILDTTAFSQPPTLTPIASDEMATCSHGSSRRAVSTVTRPLTSTPFMRTANESSQRKKKPEKRPMTKVLTSNDEAMAGVSNSKPQNRTKKGRPVTKIDTHTKLRRVSSFEADFAPVKKFRKPPVAGRKR